MEDNKEGELASDASITAVVGEKRTAEEAGLDAVPPESSAGVEEAQSAEPAPAPVPAPVPEPQPPVALVTSSPVAVRPRLTYDNSKFRPLIVESTSHERCGGAKRLQTNSVHSI